MISSYGSILTSYLYKKRVVDTPLFRDSPRARAHIDLDNDFTLSPREVVKAIMALIMNPKYPSGTILEVGDIDGWREVRLLNDMGLKGVQPFLDGKHRTRSK